MSLIRVTRGVPKYNIQIGPLDEARNHNPSAILSVTDAFDQSLMQFPYFYWVPVNEIGRSWGYKPFYAAKKVLDSLCLDLKQPLVYLCCSGGVHRSPMMAFCWLLSLPGATPETVAGEFYGRYRDSLLDKYRQDVEQGLIPKDLPTFYALMDQNPTWCYQGLLQALKKYEKITYTDTFFVL